MHGYRRWLRVAALARGTILTFAPTASRTNLSPQRHFGAVQVGAPDAGGCDRELTVTGSTFSGCRVASTTGEGGSLAIFDTSATLRDCIFESSAGTAILFESSSADGDHKLDVSDRLVSQPSVVVLALVSAPKPFSRKSDGNIFIVGNRRAPFPCRLALRLPLSALQMNSCQFNENESPSDAYASDNPQGSAVVVTNTGASDVSSD